MLQNRREFYDEIRHALSGSIELVTIDRVRQELESIGRRGSTRSAKLARVALQQLDAKQVRTIKSHLEAVDVDSAIIGTALAQKGPVAVATVDGKLRHVLSKLGITVVHLRKGHGLLVS